MTKSRLKRTWEKYVSLEATDTSLEKRAIYLNIFLEAFLAEDLKGEEIAKLFRDEGVVCNVLTRHLLADVQYICGSDNHSALLDYCLRGRGTNILTVIQKIGVEKLTYLKEFVDCLTCIYSVCWENRNNEEIEFDKSLPSLREIFTSRIAVSVTSPSPTKPKRRSLEYETARKRKRNISERSTRHSCRVSKPVEDSDTTNSEDQLTHFGEQKELSYLYRTSEVFESSETSHDDMEGDTMLCEKNLPEKSGLSSKRITSYDFCELILILLRDLCRSDSNKKCLGQFYSSDVLPFAMLTLVALLKPGEMKRSSLGGTYRLCHNLFCVIFEACMSLESHFDIVNNLYHKNVLKTVLSIAREVLPKGEVQCQPSGLSWELLKCECLNGILKLISNYALIFSNLDYVSHIHFMIKEFFICEGHELVRDVIGAKSAPLPESEKASVLNVVNSLCQVIQQLKISRSSLVHSQECCRRKHKKCAYEQHAHHHHDMLGLHFHPTMSLKDVCAITAFSIQILEAFLQAKDVDIELELLKCLDTAGICCCMPTDTLLGSLLSGLQKRVVKVQQRVFIVLEKSLYHQIGGTVSTQIISKVCMLCRRHAGLDEVSEGNDLMDSFTEYWQKRSATRLSRQIGLFMKESEESEKLMSWDSVHIYLPLLQNRSVTGLLSARHLMNLVKTAPVVLQQALCRKVVITAFVDIIKRKRPDVSTPKSDSAVNMSDSNTYVLSCCLLMLSQLLQQRSEATYFISNACSPVVMELLDQHSIRALAMELMFTLMSQETLILQESQQDQETQGMLLPGAHSFFPDRARKHGRSGKSDRKYSQASAYNNEMKVPIEPPRIDLLISTNSVVIKAFHKLLIKKTDQFLRYIRPWRPVEDSEDMEDSTEKSGGKSSSRERDPLVLGPKKVKYLSDIWSVCARLADQVPIYASVCVHDNILRKAKNLLKGVSWLLKLGPGVLKSMDDWKIFSSLVKSLLLFCLNFGSDQLISDQSVLNFWGSALINLEVYSWVQIKNLVEAMLACASPQNLTQKTIHAPEIPVELAEDLERPRPTQPQDTKNTHVEGYEGDSECTLSHPESNNGNNNGVISSGFVRLSIRYPEVCKIALELIIHSYKLGKERKDDYKEGERTLVHCLQRLLCLCQEDERNAEMLYEQGAVVLLLEGFRDLLSAEGHGSDLRQTVLVLVGLLGQHSLSAVELSKFLGFFKAPTPPLDVLLSPLCSIAEKTCQQPSTVLCYPALVQDCYGLPNTGMTEAELLHSQHRIIGVKSAWATAGCALPLPRGVSWAPHIKGFGMTLWVYSEWQGGQWDSFISTLTSTGKQGVFNLDQLLHLASIGCGLVLLEMWMCPSTAELVLRVSTSDQNTSATSSEQYVRTNLINNQWTHLAIGWTQQQNKRHCTSTVVVIVDGLRELKVTLDYTVVQAKKNQETTLLLGQNTTEQSYQTGSYRLGPVLVFQEPVSCLEEAFTLTCLGPDFTSIIPCDLDPWIPAWRPGLAHKFLSSPISWTVLWEDPMRWLKKLQDSIVLSYTPYQHQQFTCYLTETSSSALLANFLKRKGDKVKEFQPVARSVLHFSQPTLQTHMGIGPAIHTLGGLPALLFLLARVMEVSSEGRLQAKALHVLLKLVQGSPLLLAQFSQIGALQLLRYIICSRRSADSLHILKTLLDGSLNGSVILYQEKQNVFRWQECSDAIVVWPQLLLLGLDAWKVWRSSAQVSDKSELTFGAFLMCLLILLRDEHPHQAFNQFQLLQAGAVDAILNMCKERFLDDEACPPTPSEAMMLGEIMRRLLSPSSSPSLNNLSSLLNFLVLVQGADRSVISVKRENLYFLVDPRIDPLKYDDDRSNKDKKIGVNRYSSDMSEGDGWVSSSDDPSAAESASLQRSTQEIDELLKNSSGSRAGLSDKTREERAVCVLSESFLIIVRDAVLMYPDSIVHKMLSSVIPIQTLLILANNSSAANRVQLIKLLEVWITRAPPHMITSFLQQKGFLLLVNQIAPYPPTQEEVEFSWSIAMGHAFTFKGELMPSDETELLAVHRQAMMLVLGDLLRAASDVALCHNICFKLHALCLQHSKYLQACLEIGVIEAICHALFRVAVSPTIDKEEDMSNSSDYEVLVADLHTFFQFVLNKALTCTWYPSTEDAVLLLLHLEKRCEDEDVDVPFSIGSKLLKETRIKILRGMLHHAANAADKLAKMGSSADTDSENREGGGWIQKGRRRGKLEKLSTHKEMCCRVQWLLRMAVDSLIHSDTGTRSLEDCEADFSDWLFQFLLAVTYGPFYDAPLEFIKLKDSLCGVKDELVGELGKLLSWMLAPNHVLRLRMRVVTVLLKHPNKLAILRAITKKNIKVEHQMDVYLRSLGEEHSGIEIGALHSLLTHVITGIPNAQSPQLSVKQDEMEKMRMLAGADADSWGARINIKLRELLCYWDPLVKSATGSSGSLSRQALVVYHKTQKSYLVHLSDVTNARIEARASLQDMVERLTHEHALWHFSKSYPRSWQLDPTEGPMRERRRLQRCHLGLKSQHLLPQNYLDNIARESRQPPLNFLFQDGGGGETLVRHLVTREHFTFTQVCSMIVPFGECQGELVVSPSVVHFVGEAFKSGPNDNDMKCDKGSRLTAVSWHFEDVLEIHRRKYRLRNVALEVFLARGNSYLLAFADTQARERVISNFLNHKMTQLVESQHLLDLVESWQDPSGGVTNFEYLTILNKMAGRSPNDLMQYPVFPFILKSYAGDTLDLCDPANYREMKRPIAVQDKRKEEHYINNYNYLKEVADAWDSDDIAPGVSAPYHYGSHYSNSGIVLHFLVRLPPFTSLMLNFQDGQFDLPDRTFHSMETTWRMASSESSSDVKELIPEFFYMPEFLLNTEGLDLGVRQCGDRVSDVVLPSWSRNNARLFTLIHRQALESDITRENLPHWIDLVFGFKQRGKHAVDAVNVFHPATYSGWEVDIIEDPIQRQARQAMVNTYGQMPRQLFNRPHPMVAPTLSVSKLNQIPQVIPEVKGVKWGEYVGSPALPAPCIVWQKNNPAVVATLLPLRTNDVFGLGVKTTILLQYTQQKAGLSLLNEITVADAALVRWSYPDGVIRVQIQKEQPPFPLIKTHHGDSVTCCQATAELPLLVVGYGSGTLLAYRLSWGSGSIRPEKSVQLLGHTSAITVIAVSQPFSVIVSASEDGRMIIWDLNSLSYVRSVDCSDKVTLVSISAISGDIASVTASQDGQTVLHCHTINNTLVGSIAVSPTITALAYSNQPEGVSVNVIATGLSNGAIRLWSTWDLSLISEIITGSSGGICCLSYSFDSHYLFVASSEGALSIWESPGTHKDQARSPRFFNFSKI